MVYAEPALVAPPTKPWHTSGSKVYAVEYNGTAGGNLNFSAGTIESESFYRISWLMSSNLNCAENNFIMKLSNGVGNAFYGYATSSKRSLYYSYIYMPKSAPLNMSFYFNPGTARNLAVKDISIVKLTQKDLDGNPFLDGDFESSGDRPSAWVRKYNTKLTDMSIVANPEFMAGKQCMAVDFKNEADGRIGGIETIRIPVIPGREYELRLWAKSDKEFTFDVGLAVWSAFGHKGEHFYKNKTFKATTEWKLFSYRIVISSDIAKYPDLADKMISLNINGVKGDEEARVLFDNISLIPVSAPAK